MEVGCFVAINDGLRQRLPSFIPSAIPPHKVLVLSGER